VGVAGRGDPNHRDHRTVGQHGNEANATRTAVYSITGNGTADITYDTLTDGNTGSSQADGSALPWTKTVTGKGLITIFSVDAQLQTGSTVSCKITVDGKVVSSHTSTGQYAVVSCSGDG
jgi:Mycobacterium membrane protein